MLKNTSMRKCKSLAMYYLHQKPRSNEIPTMVFHPFIERSVIAYNGKLMDIFKNPSTVDTIMAHYELRISYAKNVNEIFELIRPEYRLLYFASIYMYLNEYDFSKMLSYSWKSSMFPTPDSYVKAFRLLRYFRKAHKSNLMTKNELRKFEELPEKVKIYRGISYYNNSKIALSWTLSKDRAERFANRFNEAGKVVEKEVDKNTILAYFEYDEEGKKNEVIIDYRIIK